MCVFVLSNVLSVDNNGSWTPNLIVPCATVIKAILFYSNWHNLLSSDFHTVGLLHMMQLFISVTLLIPLPAQTEKGSALHEAALFGKTDVVQRLLAAGQRRLQRRHFLLPARILPL